MEATIRPNGKVYRPRRLRSVVMDSHDGNSTLVVVLGTHDRAVADSLAEEEARRYRLDPIADAGARTSWYRQTIRGGDDVYEEDPVRGAACVVYNWDEPAEFRDQP
jgi:hypothetical protein